VLVLARRCATAGPPLASTGVEFVVGVGFVIGVEFVVGIDAAFAGTAIVPAIIGMLAAFVGVEAGALADTVGAGTDDAAVFTGAATDDAPVFAGLGDVAAVPPGPVRIALPLKPV
jgi:hypothetical protein